MAARQESPKYTRERFTIAGIFHNLWISFACAGEEEFGWTLQRVALCRKGHT